MDQPKPLPDIPLADLKTTAQTLLSLNGWCGHDSELVNVVGSVRDSGFADRILWAEVGRRSVLVEINDHIAARAAQRDDGAETEQDDEEL